MPRYRFRFVANAFLTTPNNRVYGEIAQAKP